MSELIATAASSINAFTLAKRVAAFNVPVLIQGETGAGNDSNLLIVFYVQIMPDDFVMQLHRF